jgi:acetyl-CoA acyltransferase
MLREVYLVAATRTPVGKRHGVFKATRPDDLLAHALQSLLRLTPQLDRAAIGDVIIGCAIPEAEQGLNVARNASLLAGIPVSVPAYTLNRFCASGVQAIADAAMRIRLGEADVMVAGGVESMSVMSQMAGNTPRPNPRLFSESEHHAIAYGMGLTAEKVASQYQISREDQDTFAQSSHEKALAAQRNEKFVTEISPFEVVQRSPGLKGQVRLSKRLITSDEGPREDSKRATLAKLKPVFAARGSVTAGNSAQMSDGAAAVLLMSEEGLKRYQAEPIAKLVAYRVVGVPPEVMGIGPIEAITLALKAAAWRQDDLDWIELNEAFAAQALAVMRSLRLDAAKVNPVGGAIALGHPLGATGAIRCATVLAAMQRNEAQRALITMCIGTGMGAACLLEKI